MRAVSTHRVLETEASAWLSRCEVALELKIIEDHSRREFVQIRDDRGKLRCAEHGVEWVSMMTQA
jgi:hypothetical protein